MARIPVLAVVMVAASSCSSPEAVKDTGTPPVDTASPEDSGTDSGTPEDTGDDTIAYITYAGTLAYFYGDGRPEVRDYDCELYWEISPAEPATVLDDCPDCAFGFSVRWVLDTVFSEGSGGACDTDRNGDFVMDLGFRAAEDLPGTYTGYLLERVDGTWTDQSMAVFDATDGHFMFTNGLLDEARDDGGTTVFDTNVFYGTATVWDGSELPED